MAKNRKSGRRSDAVGNSAVTESPPVDRWHSFLIAAFVALLVARTFVPEDSGGQFGHGAPFTVLWLVLAGAWLVSEFRRPRVRLAFGWTDALVVALIGWHTLSAVLAIRTGHPRPAMNMLGEWVAMGLVYLLARQLLRAGEDERATIVVMLGLAFGISLVAIHQYSITLPKDIAAFNAAKHSTQELFKETGQWLPEGSSMRQQFEARLGSRLPTAGYSLSNSMAGILVAWFTVLIGVAFGLRNRATIGISLLIAALMGASIWLAGSRSAGLAAMVGILLIVGDRIIAHGLPFVWLRRMFAVAVVGCAALLAIGVATSVGKTALAAAQRSVAFRLEYWRATLAMIRDYPFFGCGPGQFQDTYTTYKLVGAAEEIQDPHNWLLEVWANAGTPAAILLVLVILAVAVRAMRNKSATQITADTNSPIAASDSAVFGGVAGVVLGTVLAWLTEYPVAQAHVVLTIVGLLGGWYLWKQWAVDGALPKRLPLFAVLALLVNLLAAGGISYPNVADSLWLLLAIQVNLFSKESAIAPASAPPNENDLGKHMAAWPRWCAGIAMAAAIVAAIRFDYAPVMECRTRLSEADAALAAGQGDASRAAFESAMAADPWSGLAAARLADQRFADYGLSKTEATREALDRDDSRARELTPRRSKTWAQSANFAAEIFHDTGSVEYRNAAERYLQRALDLYPTSAETHSQAATYWSSVGDATRARAEAIEALRLDDAMRDAGHVDRTLRPAMRRDVEKLAQSP